MDGFTHEPDMTLLQTKNYYYYFTKDSFIEPDGRISRKHFLLKFYKNGKVGFAGGYLFSSINNTTEYNNFLKPQGYEWGLFYIDSSNIYIQIKHRGYSHTHFWYGYIKDNEIIITHKLDKKFKKNKLKKDLIFKYVN